MTGHHREAPLPDTREAILVAALSAAQAHGYGGINFRDLAKHVGVTSATIHHHFPTKAHLGVAIAKRRWQVTRTHLYALSSRHADAFDCLNAYTDLFRNELCDGNRLGLHGFMAAQHDDLPNEVRSEVDLIADVHVTWLAEILRDACPMLDWAVSDQRARAIFAAVSGAQLVARGRADVSCFDQLLRGFDELGLFRVCECAQIGGYPEGEGM